MKTRIVAARKCEVRVLELTEANRFLDENHRQGALKVDYKATSLGLFLKEELVGVVQFCFPRTAEKQRKYTTELVRLCFLRGIRVMGGASKLVAFYRDHYRPADIFTYQDATGELTDVYEHCGFTLVSQAKKKQYLVAPGKTLETATRKEALSLSYVARYGPDRILGTSLGEIKDPISGKRKTNPQLFIEELGWHLEETPGDRVYEWINPDLTFYTYKITATDSDKYYYGVSHVKKANASVEDCLTDGYYGSGGAKFSHWAKKHHAALQKEVLELFSRKAEAYLSEESLVGDSFKSDPLSLNSSIGGRRKGPVFVAVTLKFCSKCENETKHFGDSCRRCSTLNAMTLLFCPLCEEETIHRGPNNCIACANREGVRLAYCEACEVETKHFYNDCYSCRAKKHFHEEYCESCSRKTPHLGNSCRACSSRSAYSVSFCTTCEDNTVHQGLNCASCLARKSVSLRYCPSCHKETKHKGTSCYSCRSRAAASRLYCKSCDKLTSHHGGACRKCAAANRKSVRYCDVCESETTHSGESCYTCLARDRYRLKYCAHCDSKTKHQGDTCRRCVSRKAMETRKSNAARAAG